LICFSKNKTTEAESPAKVVKISKKQYAKMQDQCWKQQKREWLKI
jgi:hypothetical protein